MSQPDFIPPPSLPVLVVGAGAAGLMAAGQARLAGARVQVAEKMRLPGRKLCITGKGRCNLSNVASLPEFIDHFGATGPFLRQAFHRFFTPQLTEFFVRNGLELVQERGGRIFPASGRAPDVLAVMTRWLAGLGVEMVTATSVEHLVIEDGAVTAAMAGGRPLPCRALILATGGASYPLTGSTGDGFRLAAEAGHTIVPIRPALVGLCTAGDPAGRMSGLSLRNTRVSLYVAGKKRGEAFGELAFSDDGLAGPVILTLSGRVVDELAAGRQVVLELDLKPALTEERLDARLVRDLESRHREPIASVLRGLVPREMVDVALEAAGLDARRPASTIRAEERKRLRRWLKHFRLEVIGHRPLAEAIVTAGGIDTREIDPRTMASRLVRGLYFAGEVMDIQADTGGYNLQAAFSTGWLAGRSAAEGQKPPQGR